ncbi:replication initiator [Dactylosporangium cerinum]|uniref:Replication initiator n=1 Tax=Dactylosporangium cerinum TaxID=1434730 RepID=A0ABV9VXN4_9ACTN
MDCYDYTGHAVFNAFAGKLWHRTKQAVERHLEHLCRVRRIPFAQVVTATGRTRVVSPVRVSHGKVAEMQRRAAVHFHALLRLDGVDALDPTAVVPPPAGITVDDLETAIRAAVAHVAYTTPAHPDQPDGWPVAWGEQVDVEQLALRGDASITDTKAAGYLAKYATKATEAAGHHSTRITSDTINRYDDPDGDHIARLIHACWTLGRPTGTRQPLRERPTKPRPATRLRPPWTCHTCGTRTRLAVCRTCEPACQPGLDTATASGNTPVTSDNPYLRLRRWAHMLGYGGHFLTKARRYSTTFAFLRETRITFRRTQTSGHPEPVRSADHPDDEQRLIVLGALSFAGAGWRTLGDALLANTSAALARARREAGREELAHAHHAAPAATAAA